MQSYDARAVSSAPPSAVWSALLDTASWTRWTPIDELVTAKSTSGAARDARSSAHEEMGRQPGWLVPGASHSRERLTRVTEGTDDVSRVTVQPQPRNMLPKKQSKNRNTLGIKLSSHSGS